MGDLVQGPWPIPDKFTLPILAIVQEEDVTADTVRRWVREEDLKCETRDGAMYFNLKLVKEFRARRAA